jgi:polar amino acid transport system substrate-binding protein
MTGRIIWTICGILPALALLWDSGAATAQSNIAKRLAPTGELRVGLIGSNPVLITRGADGKLSGISVELAARLAAKLGVPLRMIPHESPSRYSESLSTDGWDLVMSGRDPTRAEFVAFCEPYLEIESLFLARPGLGLDSADQVDRPGIKVVVAKGGSQDNYLSRTLKQATLVRITSSASASREELVSGRADVFGGTGPAVYAMAASYPGAKVLAGRFSIVEQTIGLPKRNADLIPFINEFLSEAKRSGMVAAEIQRAGLLGVKPAP